MDNVQKHNNFISNVVNICNEEKGSGELLAPMNLNVRRKEYVYNRMSEDISQICRHDVYSFSHYEACCEPG
jgi:hypothetical protein